MSLRSAGSASSPQTAASLLATTTRSSTSSSSSSCSSSAPLRPSSSSSSSSSSRDELERGSERVERDRVSPALHRRPTSAHGVIGGIGERRQNSSEIVALDSSPAMASNAAAAAAAFASQSSTTATTSWRTPSTASSAVVALTHSSVGSLIFGRESPKSSSTRSTSDDDGSDNEVTLESRHSSPARRELRNSLSATTVVGLARAPTSMLARSPSAISAAAAAATAVVAQSNAEQPLNPAVVIVRAGSPSITVERAPFALTNSSAPVLSPSTTTTTSAATTSAAAPATSATAAILALPPGSPTATPTPTTTTTSTTSTARRRRVQRTSTHTSSLVAPDDQHASSMQVASARRRSPHDDAAAQHGDAGDSLHGALVSSASTIASAAAATAAAAVALATAVAASVGSASQQLSTSASGDTPTGATVRQRGSSPNASRRRSSSGSAGATALVPIAVVGAPGAAPPLSASPARGGSRHGSGGSSRRGSASSQRSERSPSRSPPNAAAGASPVVGSRSVSTNNLAVPLSASVRSSLRRRESGGSNSAMPMAIAHADTSSPVVTRRSRRRSSSKSSSAHEQSLSLTATTTTTTTGSAAVTLGGSGGATSAAATASSSPSTNTISNSTSTTTTSGGGGGGGVAVGDAGDVAALGDGGGGGGGGGGDGDAAPSGVPLRAAGAVSELQRARSERRTRKREKKLRRGASMRLKRVEKPSGAPQKHEDDMVPAQTSRVLAIGRGGGNELRWHSYESPQKLELSDESEDDADTDDGDKRWSVQRTDTTGQIESPVSLAPLAVSSQPSTASVMPLASAVTSSMSTSPTSSSLVQPNGDGGRGTTLGSAGGGTSGGTSGGAMSGGGTSGGGGGVHRGDGSSSSSGGGGGGGGGATGAVDRVGGGSPTRQVAASVASAVTSTGGVATAAAVAGVVDVGVGGAVSGGGDAVGARGEKATTAGEGLVLPPPRAKGRQHPVLVRRGPLQTSALPAATSTTSATFASLRSAPAPVPIERPADFPPVDSSGTYPRLSARRFVDERIDGPERHVNVPLPSVLSLRLSGDDLDLDLDDDDESTFASAASTNTPHRSHSDTPGDPLIGGARGRVARSPHMLQRSATAPSIELRRSRELVAMRSPSMLADAPGDPLLLFAARREQPEAAFSLLPARVSGNIAHHQQQQHQRLSGGATSASDSGDGRHVYGHSQQRRRASLTQQLQPLQQLDAQYLLHLQHPQQNLLLQGERRARQTTRALSHAGRSKQRRSPETSVDVGLRAASSVAASAHTRSSPPAALRSGVAASNVRAVAGVLGVATTAAGAGAIDARRRVAGFGSNVTPSSTAATSEQGGRGLSSTASDDASNNNSNSGGSSGRRAQRQRIDANRSLLDIDVAADLEAQELIIEAARAGRDLPVFYARRNSALAELLHDVTPLGGSGLVRPVRDIARSAVVATSRSATQSNLSVVAEPDVGAIASSTLRGALPTPSVSTSSEIGSGLGSPGIGGARASDVGGGGVRRHSARGSGGRSSAGASSETSVTSRYSTSSSSFIDARSRSTGSGSGGGGGGGALTPLAPSLHHKLVSDTTSRDEESSSAFAAAAIAVGVFSRGRTRPAIVMRPRAQFAEASSSNGATLTLPTMSVSEARRASLSAVAAAAGAAAATAALAAAGLSATSSMVAKRASAPHVAGGMSTMHVGESSDEGLHSAASSSTSTNAVAGVSVSPPTRLRAALLDACDDRSMRGGATSTVAASAQRIVRRFKSVPVSGNGDGGATAASSGTASLASAATSSNASDSDNARLSTLALRSSLSVVAAARQDRLAAVAKRISDNYDEEEDDDDDDDGSASDGQGR